ncbi:hypothetical protein ACJIZ3_010498 [Penstemon smallii]|uniref:Uncharacterized protein n=1 Tax=Penstemon smallii TaxID=265156 RepID=A0ABD3THG4_9LAMI
MEIIGGSDQQQQQWIIKINNEVNNNNDSDSCAAHWSKRSIYILPPCVTDLNKKAYKPHIVSFGPYHHGDVNLRAMEDHKRRALLHFLKRSRNIPLQSYVDALTPLVQDLKDAYDQLDHIKWNQDKFLELMIMDGCFILEVMRISVTKNVHDDYAYAINDPIFSNHGKLHIVPYLKRDMLMLENQLPITVLEILNTHLQDNKLTKLILDFFSQESSVKNLQPFSDCMHILDVYRKSLLLEEPHHQGKKNKTKSLKDISFSGGILKLPFIAVDDALESLYLNLIAFERFHVGAGNEIIDNARDVNLLHSCGIIQNALGSDKAVANLFNSLSKDITFDQESNLANVHNLVTAYCHEPWHQWRANLMHTYFTNPWAILSFSAAIFLFTLTIVQTVYLILSLTLWVSVSVCVCVPVFSGSVVFCFHVLPLRKMFANQI